MSKLNNSDISIVLYEPRIPQNTGNIGRTCLAFNFKLVLIEPLGFNIDDKQLKRAGLDYWKNIDLYRYPTFNKFKKSFQNSRIISFSKQGGISLSSLKFRPNDCLLFGREDIGLPEVVKSDSDIISTIDMPCLINNENSRGVRSLNLSVSCGIAAYFAHCSLSNQN